jgi:hypothetical protein
MNVELFGLAIMVGIICTFVLRRLHQWIVRFSHRAANDVFPFLLKIEVDALYGTFHPDVEKYFRDSMPATEFKQWQWKRIHLAIHYCNQISNNTQVFLSWTRHERKHSWLAMNPEMRRTAKELRAACLRSSLTAILIRSHLRWWLLRMALLPFAVPPTFSALLELGSLEMISFYEKVKTIAETFSLGYGEEYHDKLMQAF